MLIISEVIKADHFASRDSLQLGYTDIRIPYLNLVGSESFVELSSDIFSFFMKQRILLSLYFIY